MNNATNSGNGNQRPYSEAEDNILRGLVNLYDEDWEKVETKFNETMLRFNLLKRSVKSLRLRWQYHSNKNSKLPFTTEEDELLVAKVNEYGPNAWRKITTFFLNRNINQLKTRYNILNALKRIVCKFKKIVF